MSAQVKQRLLRLQSDYIKTTGNPFDNFFCPVLFKDEAVKLCRAHLVNQAFTSSSRKWTIQRADVDSFYGSFFESDFLEIRHRGTSVESFFRDPASVKHLRPKTYVNSKLVDHYIAKGPVPPDHAEVNMHGSDFVVRLALKLKPSQMLNGDGRSFLEVAIQKDCRMSALVSLLKAAHLCLFDLLGYPYALSAGGMFLGHTVLGSFFEANRGFPKADILRNAETHFAEYSNLVRPVLNPEVVERDTVSHQLIGICEGVSRWAFLVYIKTSDLVHAVVVPILETPDAAAIFVSFLKSDGGAIQIRDSYFDGEIFHVSSGTTRILWPASSFR